MYPIRVQRVGMECIRKVLRVFGKVRHTARHVHSVGA